MKKIIFFLSLIFLFNSCDFETGGCTDPLAYNYESFADFDAKNFDSNPDCFGYAYPV